MEPGTLPITREAALRVALAARAMPRVTLPALIEQLQRRLGETLDEEKLRQVTVTMLKTGFASTDGGPAAEILKPFQTAMVESPPPWLLKIFGVAAEKRLKNYNAEVNVD